MLAREGTKCIPDACFLPQVPLKELGEKGQRRDGDPADGKYGLKKMDLKRKSLEMPEEIPGRLYLTW